MLQKLLIQNIILIDQETLEFDKGLNIITGETGSGKTAILYAIKQLLGDKADSNLIRTGGSLGIIEGYFSIEKNASMQKLLHRESITFDLKQPLIIRKELSIKGKSRTFINDQVAQASFVKELGAYLIEILTPHSHQKLFSSLVQRELLDQYGALQKQKEEFSNKYFEMFELKKQIDELKQIDYEKLLAKLLEQIDEIETVGFQQDEDRTLTKEHHLLSHIEEVSALVSSTQKNCDQIIPMLNVSKNDLDTLCQIDPNMTDNLKLIKEAYINLEEISYTLRSYHAKLEPNPHRLKEIEDRFYQIETLKKRYGKDYLEIQGTYLDLQKKKQELSNLEYTILDKEHKLNKLEKICFDLGKTLTDKRKQIALDLEKQVIKALQELNISHPRFLIKILEDKMGPHGLDKVDFTFSANLGLDPKPLKDCASTGELARVFLAIKTLIAKNESHSLVFDEIDANVGGKTASLIGQKLSTISSSKQVICITHFVQVAKFADLHFQVEKIEKDGCVTTKIIPLVEKNSEFSRMIGV